MHHEGTMAYSVTLVLLLGLITGCASNPNGDPGDPYESTNRKIYNFNDAIDRNVLQPVARSYVNVTPKPVRTGFTNFFANAGYLNVIANDLLQGKPGQFLSDSGRFIVNSTFGIGGLFDPATASGLEAYPERFGETFAVWGMADGPYVVLPVLGPNTISSAIGLPFGFLADPLFYADDDSTKWIVYGIRAIHFRERLFAAEEALFEDSFDRYLTLRESYLQNWRFRIYDGDPPEDEDFYDEFLDEE